MKKTISLCLGLALVLLASASFAHAPSDMILSYDPSVSELTVAVAHSSGNPQAHYIEQIEISVNGELAIIERPEAQNDPAVSVDVFDLDLQPGDVVLVQAFCNRGGDLSREFIVEE